MLMAERGLDTVPATAGMSDAGVGSRKGGGGEGGGEGGGGGGGGGKKDKGKGKQKDDGGGKEGGVKVVLAGGGGGALGGGERPMIYFDASEGLEIDDVSQSSFLLESMECLGGSEKANGDTAAICLRYVDEA